MTANNGHPSPPTLAHEKPPSRCARSCCWSPLGHATGRDHLPDWHPLACHCHDDKETR